MVMVTLSNGLPLINYTPLSLSPQFLITMNIQSFVALEIFGSVDVLLRDVSGWNYFLGVNGGFVLSVDEGLDVVLRISSRYRK